MCKAEEIEKVRANFQPTRLLYVGTSPSHNVRLRESSDLPAGHVKYVALSHRWGIAVPNTTSRNKSKPVSQLLSGNINDMKTKIEYERLPQNFKDAIVIAQRIGIEYLWIDSLCIIQDQEKDWDYESKWMGSIYAHAELVISATGAINGDGGCFLPKESLSYPPICVLRRNVLPSWFPKALVLSKNTATEDWMEQLFNEKVESAELTTRGWTFQERILARRIVHFCDGVVLYECNTMRASEHNVNGTSYLPKSNLRMDGGPREQEELQRLMRPDDRYVEGTRLIWRDTGNPAVVSGGGVVYGGSARPVEVSTMVLNPNYRDLDHRRLDFFLTAALNGMRGDFRLLLSAKLESDRQKAEFHHAWFALVKEFSARALTYERDRLSAIEGVGLLIGRATGKKFVAGGWYETLCLNLLWNTIGEEPQRQPLSDAVAPSWAWPSVKGGIGAGVESQVARLYDEPPYPDIHWLVDDVNIIQDGQSHLDRSKLMIGLRGCLDAEPMSTVHIIPDSKVTATVSDEMDSTCENSYLPLIRFSRPSDDPDEVHGIIVRREPCNKDIFKRVAYFWTDTVHEETYVPSHYNRKLPIKLI
jgi:hypothetical protein